MSSARFYPMIRAGVPSTLSGIYGGGGVRIWITVFAVKEVGGELNR